MRAWAAAAAAGSSRQPGGSTSSYSACSSGGTRRSNSTAAARSVKSNQSSTFGLASSGPAQNAARATTSPPRSATQVHSGRYSPPAASVSYRSCGGSSIARPTSWAPGSVREVKSLRASLSASARMTRSVVVMVFRVLPEANALPAQPDERPVEGRRKRDVVTIVMRDMACASFPQLGGRPCRLPHTPGTWTEMAVVADNFRMTSVEYGFHSPRISDAERERALEVLRQGLVDGRVSQDTFVRRMELIMGAVRLPELQAAIRDLPYDEAPPARTGGWLLGTVTRLSAFNERLRRAWRSERLPQLLLPAPGPLPLSIGRASGSGLRLNHASVSRQHALLSGTGSGWVLRDLGSSNGTWVNGRRVTDTVRVRPGDHVSFGAMAFRLSARNER
jgi:hypothetical protein